MASDGKLRLGVLGLGLAGSLMIGAVRRPPSTVIAAAADQRQRLRDNFSRDFNAPAYDRAEALAADPGVDAIYIATPHQFHRDHAILAARHGKHIIVEKPMALTLADCDAIIAAVAEAGVMLVVGHSHSFDPNVVAIADLVASGAFGRLAMVNMWNYNDFLYRPRRPEELDTALGGGIIFNQLPHQIDTARLIAGSRVRSVRAHTAILDPARPTEGGSIVFLDFESGAAASLVYCGYDHFDSDEFHYWVGEGGGRKEPGHGRTRRSLRDSTREKTEAELKSERFGYGSPLWRAMAEGQVPHQPHFGVLIASCEKADLKPSADGVLIYGDDGVKEHPLPVPPGTTGYANVLDELATAIKTRKPPVHDARWGRHTVQILHAILQSSRERREVVLQG